PLGRWHPQNLQPAIQSPVEHTGKYQSQRRNRQQRRHSRHRIVDPRSNPSPTLIDGTHHRRSQRSHANRHPKPKHNNSRKNSRPPPQNPPRQQTDPRRRNERPDNKRPPRSIPPNQAARPAR